MSFLKKIIKIFLPQSLISFYHYLLTFFGAIIFCFPSRNLKVIGVTGTNGKSTTVEFIKAILEEKGYKTASISSIRFQIKDKTWPNMLKMTMPEGFLIQKFLRMAKKEKCDYVVLEVTSQGILQYRHKFIDFKTAVFTNLSPEHIEAHGGFENYKRAKGKLFLATKNIHVINLDDKNAPYFLSFYAQKKIGFGIEVSKEKYKFEKEVDKILIAEKIEESSDGVRFKVNGVEFHLKLLGKFNVYNALAAIGVALSENIELEVCKKALEKIYQIPGRMEVVIWEPFKVIIDYAVCPESLEQLYQEIEKLFNPKGMICLFGACGGGRDKWKRPKLGEIAQKYCQKIILTNEDPYDEDPVSILNQIEEGIEDKSKVLKILDRREAIRNALTLAKNDQVIVLTGKGSEPWMCLKNGKKIPWDEKRIVLEEYERLRQKI